MEPKSVPPAVMGRACPPEIMGDHPRVWICGRTYGPNDWELFGIFATEAEAVAACRIPNNDFVSDIPLGVRLSEVCMWWGYFPLMEVQGDGTV